MHENIIDSHTTSIGSLLIEGDSMYPILRSGEIVLYSRRIPLNILRYSIVYFQNGDKLYIKRIIGIPGDALIYTGGYLYINNIPQKNTLGEYYKINSQVLHLIAQDFPIIPADSYLVLGNKIDGTNDSSVYGFISYKQILGILGK